MTMIPTRCDILTLSRVADGDYQLRIGEAGRWVPVDRPGFVALHDAVEQLLAGRQEGARVIPTQCPTDTITLSPATDGGYALRIGKAHWAFLDRPHCQVLHDAVAQLLADTVNPRGPKEGGR